MLTGKELGDAIKRAIDLKIDSGAAKSKAEIARHFGVKPPSIHDWIKRGVIGKDKLPELFRYFSDVVGPDHWGIQSDNWLDHDHTAPTPNTEPGPPVRAQSIGEMLDQLRERLCAAPDDVRHEVNQLVMRYMESDDEDSASRLLRAIEALLDEHDGHSTAR